MAELTADGAGRSIDINVPLLTRVEGEGSLEFTARDGHIEALHLRIFEPPRLFEKFLEGQDHTRAIALERHIKSPIRTKSRSLS